MRLEVRALSERLDTWESCIRKVDEKKRNTLRREQYREARRRREEGLLALPDRPVLLFRNGLLAPRLAQWVQTGMRFAAADQPGPFVTWLVHQWNSHLPKKADHLQRVLLPDPGAPTGRAT